MVLSANMKALWRELLRSGTVLLAGFLSLGCYL